MLNSESFGSDEEKIATACDVVLSRLWTVTYVKDVLPAGVFVYRPISFIPCVAPLVRDRLEPGAVLSLVLEPKEEGGEAGTSDPPPLAATDDASIGQTRSLAKLQRVMAEFSGELMASLLKLTLGRE